MIFTSRFCLIKCRSISTCFVRSCWIGLCEILIAVLLLQNRFILQLAAKSISVNNLLSHRSSQRPLAILQNSASALDNATIFCFLLFHVTRFPPTKVKYPEVDFLSEIFPTQSASIYPSIFIWLFFENRIPFLGEDFKYQRILIAASMWSSLGQCINWLTTLTA
jgi:hypothetical protein